MQDTQVEGIGRSSKGEGGDGGQWRTATVPQYTAQPVP